MKDGLIIKCSGCDKKLDASEAHFIPGKVVYDKVSDMTYPTGKTYCDKCFEKFAGVRFDEVESGIFVEHPEKEERPVEKKKTVVFKGSIPSYEIDRGKHFGFVQKIIHAKARNGAKFIVVRFRGNNTNFYVWDKKLYENIGAGDTIDVEYLKTKFPRIVLIKKYIS